MAKDWTAERLPRFEPALRRLIEQHRALEDEPLHLALAYLPRRNGRELSTGIFLFEVIGGPASSYSPSGELLEATFEAAPGLPTGFNQPLHLILTTPGEFEEARAGGGPLALDVSDAVRRGDYKVLHSDAMGRQVLNRIRAAVVPRKRAARG